MRDWLPLIEAVAGTEGLTLDRACFDVAKGMYAKLGGQLDRPWVMMEPVANALVRARELDEGELDAQAALVDAWGGINPARMIETVERCYEMTEDMPAPDCCTDLPGEVTRLVLTGALLADARGHFWVAQQTVAQVMLVDQTTISRWLNHLILPQRLWLVRIAANRAKRRAAEYTLGSKLAEAMGLHIEPDDTNSTGAEPVPGPTPGADALSRGTLEPSDA